MITARAPRKRSTTRTVRLKWWRGRSTPSAVELDLAVARKVVEVNCVSALSWVRQAHRSWMHKDGGAVVNVASVAGIQAVPDIGFYGASKAMLIHITQTLAIELGPDIRVNAVAPAVVKTRFATALYSATSSGRHPSSRSSSASSSPAFIASSCEQATNFTAGPSPPRKRMG